MLSKILQGPDVRFRGSGHTGGLNTLRLLGRWAGVTTIVVDAAKGLLAWGAADLLTQGHPWSLPVAGTLAVIGHCWPVYTRFHGGMGLATGGTLMLVQAPLVVILVALIWLALFAGLYRKRYSPRCVALALLLGTGLSLVLIPLAPPVRWFLILVTLVLVGRHLPEWNRVV